MDWSKVDAALAGALSASGDAGEHQLSVFIEMDATRADRSVLARLGVDPPEPSPVCTATLSAADVEDLTEMDWVRRLQLSRPLRLLPEC